MVRKFFRTGNSVVVSLPREALDYLNIQEGTEIEVALDRENRQVILKPVARPWQLLVWTRHLLARLPSSSRNTAQPWNSLRNSR